MNYYNCCSIAMKPEMKKVDICAEDGCPFMVPSITYDGITQTSDNEQIPKCNEDSVLVKKNNHIVKYTEEDYYDLLLENDDGETSWSDVRFAYFLYDDIDRVIDRRATRKYIIEDYDIEKMIGHRYKVVLEETFELNEYDHRHLKNFFKNNDDGYIITEDEE